MLTSISYAFGYEDLLPDEKNTVDIFQKFSPKVVYVHRLSSSHIKDADIMRLQTGAGSGFVWDKEGHIVTNFHVVDGAGELRVTIGNLTAPAKVLGVDPRKDIAVLAITSPQILEKLKDFVPFQLVPTKTLLVGQSTFAIGNPFGLDHTLTDGVLSALGRQVPGFGGVNIRDMIQTDAPINPGNSGGPLLDSHGRLIGMNTTIYSRSGSSAGIGFAIPADDIQHAVPQIIRHGRVIFPGIGIHRVDDHIAHQLGVQKGVLISQILNNSPAEQVGLKGTYRNPLGHVVLGDVIIGLNGHDVPDYDALYNLLSGIKVGDTVTLDILRDGKKLQFHVKTVDITNY